MSSEAIQNNILETLASAGRPIEFQTLFDSTGLEISRDLFQAVVSKLVLQRQIILTSELKLAARHVKSASFGALGWRECEDMPDPTASAPTGRSCVLPASRA